MSHVAESDFCVTDIELLKQVVAEKCPTLELVQTNEYRTWASDHDGRLVGDYPLPGIYQVRVLREAAKLMGNQGLVIRAAAKQVTIPYDFEALEDGPLSLSDFQKLVSSIPDFKTAYETVMSQIGHDAEYVIRHKDPVQRSRQYGIALVPNPVREGEWDMICDFYSQGYGILNEPGVGKHKQEEGKDIWAGTLKQAYNVAAAEQIISYEAALGSPVYQQSHKEVLADGTVKITLTGY